MCLRASMCLRARVCVCMRVLCMHVPAHARERVWACVWMRALARVYVRVSVCACQCVYMRLHYSHALPVAISIKTPPTNTHSARDDTMSDI